MAQLGIGVIGCGSMGSGLAGAARDVGARIVGGADPDPEQLARFAEAHNGAKQYSNLQDLLADDAVQAVLVATPNHLHCEHTLAAAQAGRHVFCEKPMALTVADCDRMIQACKKAGVKLMVGQVLRYIPDLQRILRIVHSGELGKPAAASIERLWGTEGKIWRIPWRTKKELAGGWLYEVNVHEVDYLCQILGEPTQAYGATAKFVESQHDLEDLAVATFRFAGGGIGLLQGGSCSPLGRYEVAVFCDQGDLFVDRGVGVIRYKKIGQDPQEEQASAIQAERPVQREIREFVEAVTDGKPVTIPGEDGRRAIAMIEAAYKSAATGQVVTIT